MGAAWFLLLFLSTTTAAAEEMDDGESFIDLMDTNSDYVGGGGPKSRERAEALLVVGGGTPVPYCCGKILSVSRLFTCGDSRQVK